MPEQKKPVFSVGDIKKVRKKLKNLTADEIAALNWYYKMELKPGCFTGGHTVFTNMIPTEALLKRVNVDGLRTLDVGGMECAFSVLLDRAGAYVEVYDRIDNSDRVKLVKEAYKSEFTYHVGKPFHKFVADQIRAGDKGYDFVLFSGVLYHTIEPALFLYHVRSPMKPGAIMVMETSLIPDEECCIYFNEAGRFYKGTNYYQVTSTWLDYTLRLMGFKIHNASYVTNKKWKGDGRDVVRCSLILELTEEPVVGPRDKWAKRRLIDAELAEFGEVPKYKEVDLSDRILREGFAKYGVEKRKDLFHKGTQSLNLTKLLALKKPLPINEETCTRYLNDRL